MEQNLLAHQSGNCKPCSYFYFKEELPGGLADGMPWKVRPSYRNSWAPVMTTPRYARGPLQLSMPTLEATWIVCFNWQFGWLRLWQDYGFPFQFSIFSSPLSHEIHPAQISSAGRVPQWWQLWLLPLLFPASGERLRLAGFWKLSSGKPMENKNQSETDLISPEEWRGSQNLHEFCCGVRGDDIKWIKHIESSATRMMGPSVGMAHPVTKILLTGSVFASGWCCWWWPQSLVRWPLKIILIRRP